MTLTDAGPLVAIIDRRDQHHARCLAAVATLPAPLLLTTWACLGEAMYLLGREGGHDAQDELWAFIADGFVRVHQSADAETARMRELMRQYRDTPMDFADASLVAAAETLGLRRVFTVDHHFYVYRVNGNAFVVVPS